MCALHGFEQQLKMMRIELDRASKIDPGLQAVIKHIGYPRPRIREPGFSTLVQIINAQLLSTAAATAIWNRLVSGCQGEVTVQKLLNRSDNQLREYGLSFRKISYIKGLANLMLSDTYQLAYLQSLDDTKVIRQLTKVRGIGQWSAEIYAMFALARTNIFPSKDLALQQALKIYFQLAKKPDEKTTKQLSEQWSPHKSAVALLMWKLYGSTTLENRISG